MRESKVLIKGEHGLHLRKAAQVVRLSQECQSKITLCKGCQCADTCSILEVLSLAAERGDELKIVVEGPDEESAAARIFSFFRDGEGI